MSRENGTVTFTDNLKGFGFIRREAGKDAFFVYSEVNGFEGSVELFAGDSVSFDVVKDGKGPRAISVTKV